MFKTIRHNHKAALASATLLTNVWLNFWIYREKKKRKNYRFVQLLMKRISWRKSLHSNWATWILQTVLQTTHRSIGPLWVTPRVRKSRSNNQRLWRQAARIWIFWNQQKRDKLFRHLSCKQLWRKTSWLWTNQGSNLHLTSEGNSQQRLKYQLRCQTSHYLRIRFWDR